jgi:putative cell wall-binding protein
VITRFDVMADALAGVSLSVAKHGPLLLSDSDHLPTVVHDEILRITHPRDTVYLLGGPLALSPAIEDAVLALGRVPVRVAGATRIETDVAVAKLVGPAKTALIVNSLSFPDALSAAAALDSVAGGAHILFTNATSVPPATAFELAFGRYTNRIVFGGKFVISDSAYLALGANQRISGSNRDGTAVAAALQFRPDVHSAWLSDGTDFVGSVLAAQGAAVSHSAFLLDSAATSQSAENYVRSSPIGTLYVIGPRDKIAAAWVHH